MQRHHLYYPIALFLLVLLFVLNLLVGSVSIPARDVAAILMGEQGVRPSWQFIVMESRLPQAVTALLCGGALGVTGLLLQTAFRNPLAGPGIFGISSGAGLGVAIVMLLLGGSLSAVGLSLSGFVALLGAAFAGAMAVTLLLLFFSLLVRNGVMLLIVGVMVGYVANAAITLLNYLATEEGVRSYMLWGMGSFSGVSLERLPLFGAAVAVGLLGAVLLVKPLNVLLLGDRYAESLGISTRRVRHLLLVVTGVLTAVTTAFCGPVAFIGLAVPHLARLTLGTGNHRHLLPATLLAGAVVALCCQLACCLPPSGTLLPLNAVTSLVGAPVIIYVIVRRV